MINSATGNFNHINGRIFFNKEPFTGSIYTLFPSGDTAEISEFSNGKEDGICIKFYSDGRIREKRQFDHGQKTGLYQAWWENSKEKLLYRFENDEYEGICQEWNREGKLIKEMNYRRGHEEGQQKLFYDNGKVRANYIVMNGRRYGLLGTKNCVNVSDSVFKN
ncbi:toxin-antitoxin system YwqK family antitoxin [Dyadobacter subterraneus]|uniref:Toxin-antitoxin system YwqK family antitoxin n=1 Tax=Dyadobacter subterraneus TaxID=2773304 RepID=A0ABR9WDG3_9BACT|nr:toxin-antitoxin system YwqK family antitoxin [Dyadobacter subterraneus]MBE9462396.1 toxin-antitoxin system YwqK family antitoxin [Dyadobacter subterraneus]